MNETGNNNAGGYDDATAHGYNGTGVGMAAGTTVASVVGLGQVFDGATQRIGINPAAISTTAGSISCWVQTPAAFSGDPTRRLAVASDNAYRYWLGHTATGVLYAALGNNTNFGTGNLDATDELLFMSDMERNGRFRICQCNAVRQ